MLKHSWGNGDAKMCVEELQERRTHLIKPKNVMHGHPSESRFCYNIVEATVPYSLLVWKNFRIKEHSNARYHGIMKKVNSCSTMVVMSTLLGVTQAKLENVLEKFNN
jgi:hypothetical protein